MAINSIGSAAQSSSTTGDTTPNSIFSSSGSMDSTFLSLLVTELKTQDPSSPLDANQMVAQMVSLNQLDQLISIHSLLSGAAAQTSSTSATGGN